MNDSAYIARESHSGYVEGPGSVCPMPLLCSQFHPGCMQQAIDAITDIDLHAIAQAEGAYYRDEPALAFQIAEPYLQDPRVALRLSAGFICGYACFSLNRIKRANECLHAVIDAAKACDSLQSESERAACSMIAASASVLLHLPLPCSQSELTQAAHALPEGLRLFASYTFAHNAYLNGNYGRCIGMAENALIMRQGEYPIAQVFLHLVLAMGYMSQKDTLQAQTNFSEAWDIAQPDNLYVLIGGHHGLLQGLVEKCLKTDYSKEYSRIIDITYRFSYGWRRLHELRSGEMVADDLTTTEFSVAMLACRHWTNAEIAHHLDLSTGTVKNYLSSVYAKLGIANRTQLKNCLLK